VAEFVFSLNGREVTVEADPKTPSLEVLREHLGVHTCKAGCSPQGICGCCTALLDGKPRLTCTLPVKSLAGKAVTTMDGLPEADRALFAESFVCTGGTQCGYCTPGIVLNAWSVLQANASPTPEEITRALQAHLCRCTGYTAIAAAIERAAAVKRGEADVTPPRSRPEGADVVLGDRPYVDDLERPGMLYGGAVFAPVAVGTVDAVELDAAKAIPGVRLVLARKQAGDTLAHAGEIIVAIAAESPSAVRAAVAAVVVKATARAVGTDLASAPVVGHATAKTGDVDAGLASAAHRAGGHFRVAASDPVYLEPEAALAVPTGTDAAPSLHVYSAGHDAAGEAASLTEALGVPVRVFLVPSGGSYGGKEVRLVAQGRGERNYHAFYQLLAGADAPSRAAWELGPPGAFAFRAVSESGCTALKDADAAVRDAQVVQAARARKVNEMKQLLYDLTGGR
jgi:xanthine dehydrogenase molybdenum-binding subunit